MAKQGTNQNYLSATDQYLIDAVRTFRINLDLSQNSLSEKAGKHKSLVSTAESTSTTHKYTDDELHAFAHVFSAEAVKVRQLSSEHPIEEFKTEYTLSDFYPKEPLDDILVLKSNNVISNKIYPTGAVRYLLENTEFFNSARTTNEITDKSNSLFHRGWHTTDFVSPLERATRRGFLIKTDPPAVVTFKKGTKMS